ncbi:Putative protein [Zobellia galactanivorans]|uniref:Uncharacterized protein n=1 Tax=Zobellia galactanivorans (strain DSM 12802 / CCUG 47099 / CIP 106680 / NCIMB 13871 / Dsij) TaxID=63186 RepID=G0L0M4_ZOBGA|nr:Putative protein [Zobellia galactanivorans]
MVNTVLGAVDRQLVPDFVDFSTFAAHTCYTCKMKKNICPSLQII